MKELLHDLLRARASAPALAWLDKALAALAGPLRTEQVLASYAAASRRMGKQALALSEAERARVQALDGELALDRWGLDEAARAAAAEPAAAGPGRLRGASAGLL